MIFAAITKLANAMASLPLKLYKNREHQRDHPLDYLLSTAPNGHMTAFNFIQTMEVLRNAHGNAYAMKQYGRNMEIKALNILDPTRVTPVLDEKTSELYYMINAPSGTYYVHNLDMVHVRHISVSVKGISPIEVLRETTEFDAKIRRINIEGMENAIKASFELKLATNLSDDKKAALRKQFEDFYSKNGGVIITESGQELKPLKSEFIDTKLFDAEKVTASRIALVFGLPPYKFGAESRAGNEEQSIGFVQDVILPTARQYELEFNRKILTVGQNLEGFGYKFNLSGLLRADTKTRGDFYFRGIRSGLFSPNDARELEDLPPHPDGDRLFISRDLVPLDATDKNEVVGDTNRMKTKGAKK